MSGGYRFTDWPLRARLAGLLVVASVLPLAVATYINVRDTRTLVLARTAALLEARSDQLANEIDTLNATYRSAADRIAHVLDALGLSSMPGPSDRLPNLDSLQSLLSVMPDRDPRVLAVALVDTTGTVKAASRPALAGVSLKQRSFVRNALAGTPDVSDVRISEVQTGSQASIAFAAPIHFATGPIQGAAIVWVRADALWDIMKSHNGLAGTGSFAALMDSDGVRIGHTARQEIVFHPGAALPAATLEAQVAEQRFGPRTRELLQDVRPFRELYDRAVAHSVAPTPFRGISPVNNAWNYGVGRRLHTVPWTVFYLIPEDSVFAELTQTVRNRILFGSLIGLLALLTGAAVAANILRPIRSLAGATAAIAGGDLTTRVAEGRADELGRLAASFNAMAERIELQSRELQRSHDELEERVRQRTAELARAMQKLQEEALERARAEESSRASRELLEGIVRSTDDAIISKTLEGVITSWNPGAEKLFGYPAGQAIGQSMHMVIPTDRAAEEPEILARIARGERVEHLETVRRRADGTLIDISATISPLSDSSGRISGASTIARDITERKASDRRIQAQLERLNLLQHITRAIGERQDLHSIFSAVIGTLEDQLPVDFSCVCQFQAADDFLTVSRSGPGSEALAGEMGMTADTRIPIDANGLSRCIHGQLVYEPDVTQVHHPFPQRFAAIGLRSLVVAPLLVESQVFGVLVAARRRVNAFSSSECEFLRQVAEHTALATKQAELHNALQTAYEDLRQTQQAVMQHERLRVLGQMASGIAHDINNAISPVTLYTEFLLDNEPDLGERTRDYLRTIQRAVGDVADTVARMREFYRERDAQTFFRPVQLNQIVEQVLDLTRARWSDMAQRKGAAIDVRTQLAADIPDVPGSESELREALTNLVINAVDAMPSGGSLTLRTTAVTGPLGPGSTSAPVQSVLEVIDTGVGMDDATRRRCLEPFFTTKGEQGTGLGLAMVYGTMQRHGAEMEIESTPGRGTTVRLRFTPPRAAAVVAPATVNSMARPRKLRILLIDDDPVLLKSLRDVLEVDGHTVTAANGGQAGVEAFVAARGTADEFSVVITDLGMPQMDGRRVAAAIKTASATTPVILLTGWGQRLIAEADVPPHVDRVLSKPPRLTLLRAALAELTAD